MGKSAKDWKDEAIAFENQDDFEGALECYNKALKLNPEDAYLWYSKGLLIAYRSGKFHDAIKCFDQAINFNPEYEKAWRDKGLALSSLERYEDAMDCYDEAVKLNPEDSDAWAGKGMVQAALWEAAIEEHEEAGKGGALSYNGKIEAAMKCVDKAIELNSQNNVAWGYKASIANSLGKYDEALKCINKSLEIDPEDQGALSVKEEIMQRYKDNTQEIKNKIQKLESEINNLNKECSKRFHEAGNIAYTQYQKTESNLINIPELKSRLDAVISLDLLINKANQDIVALNSREKKSGFFAKLGDAFTSTAKIGKLKIDLYSLGNKKDTAITEFGEKLYATNKNGTKTLGELSSIWQKVDDFNKEIDIKEGEISDFKK